MSQMQARDFAFLLCNAHEEGVQETAKRIPLYNTEEKKNDAVGQENIENMEPWFSLRVFLRKNRSRRGRDVTAHTYNTQPCAMMDAYVHSSTSHRN